MHIMAQKFNSKPDISTLGIQLRKARKARGMTLTSLSEEVGVHHSQISRMERGEVVTANKSLQKICKFLGVAFERYLEPASSLSLGERVEQLLRVSPENEPALRKMVEALEILASPPQH
ncbi:helix-turn-helix domain-containing protein [Pseudomonas aeruginosa]|uniref:helix-turn-helix domain-containing protein n=3 Tax=Pseudomonas aeruginosa TaxID=287 RepID=UPI00093674F7|nr:helix-turn-helix transcriptional regulator [Pseudomonas aeruginosa]ELP0276355.1 helix-turn-helix transcriptional regulator [Pseudomonas aeruginosa]MBG4805758.1 helix-turn-helix transcriptional regulator [Pseudomonas aeruginosa]MBG5029283.1 helix-turn-helix transcriptional regulator [Pseudomonas aeruginosa]MBI7447200.1 helix-turn-helix transcriptional regulator [Pseudomonas aeruginosa]